jgi:hypothetical protein
VLSRCLVWWVRNNVVLVVGIGNIKQFLVLGLFFKTLGKGLKFLNFKLFDSSMLSIIISCMPFNKQVLT